MAYIFKYIQDNHRVTIDDGYEVISEVSFGAIVRHTSFQLPLSPNLFKITTELLLVMDRKSYLRFIWHHCLWYRVTWRGQIEVRHISEGRNLETLRVLRVPPPEN